MTTLSRASSIPALMKLGMSAPKLENNHKRSGFDFKSANSKESAFNVFRPQASSQQALDFAVAMQKPSWRLTATEPRERAPTAEEDIIPRNQRYPRVCPAWLKHEKQVLRFYGFYQEAVTERTDENSRKRNIIVMFHLEDGTISMCEPKVENSGIPQGAFLKRQRVPRADGKGFFGPDDFRVGSEVGFYARTYHLTGCDRFTRWFYGENGIDVGDDEELGMDQWSKSYKFMKTAEKGGLPSTKSAIDQKIIGKYSLGAPPIDMKLTQFLLNDRKVLAFKAYWDDHTPYGARIYFNVNYYLADNTIEFNEAHSRNSGRYPSPVFMKRGPLHKKNHPNCVPGMLSADAPLYLPEDLMVGDSINVWGRKVVFFDCDDFTAKFYKDYLGIHQKASTMDVSEKPMTHAKLAPPPHHRGREEDSIISCQMINPKAPKIDLEKMMVLSGEVLRFEAKLVNGIPEDEMRVMVIAYYPADDEVAVFELPVRNSGHWIGKFADKRRMKNPDTMAWFKLADLVVGKVVTIAASPFLITRADEHCLQFLEERPHQFQHSDPVACSVKLAPLKGEPEMHDADGLDPDRLKGLAHSMGIDIMDHEIITLLRRFGIGDAAAPRVHGPSILETARA